MLSYHPVLPQGHDLRFNDWPWQGGHHSCRQEVSALDWGCYRGHWGFHQINVYFYAYKVFLKFSCFHLNYLFYCFECWHRVCPNLSSAPCILARYRKKLMYQYHRNKSQTLSRLKPLYHKIGKFQPAKNIQIIGYYRVWNTGSLGNELLYGLSVIHINFKYHRNLEECMKQWKFSTPLSPKWQEIGGQYPPITISYILTIQKYWIAVTNFLNGRYF